MQPNPLAQGNRLQRSYHAWAAPYYARMAPPLREQAEQIDALLYSRRGLAVWLGLPIAMVATGGGLRAAGAAWSLAIVLSLMIWVVLPLAGLSAWLQPDRFAGPRLRKAAPLALALGFSGALVGFTVAHVEKRGRLDVGQLLDSLWQALGLLVPVVLAALLVYVALLWGIARLRQKVVERELQRVTLAAERDAAARQAAEARLKLLQGQIQPHFIFNTLSALQHWVDTGDRRAGPLLQSLSSFLRGSTDLLGRTEATLGEEAAMAGHYLSIQQARLGPRLTYRIDIEAGLAAKTLPPGLLLTLVENAVEHGIAASLTGGEVRVTAERDGASWRVCVSDTGSGLPTPWREGVGLANCRERLLHCFGSGAQLAVRAQQPGTQACIVVEDGAQ